jgi:hypothetical protein
VEVHSITSALRLAVEAFQSRPAAKRLRHMSSLAVAAHNKQSVTVSQPAPDRTLALGSGGFSNGRVRSNDYDDCKRRRRGHGFTSTFRASLVGTAWAPGSTRKKADRRTGNAPCHLQRFCRPADADHAAIHAQGPRSRLPLPAPQQQIPSLPRIHQGCTPHARPNPPMRLSVTTPVEPLCYTLSRWDQTDTRPRH